MSTLEERLASASTAVRELALAQQHIDDLNGRIEELADTAANQRAEHRSESDDVERLEGLTLTRFFAAVSGSHDDKLARERAEADAAHLRLRHTQAQLDVLRRDRERAQARVADLMDAPQRLSDVLEEKEVFLREVGDMRADRLFELAEEEGRLRGDTHELAEAVEGAQAADAALGQAAQSLDRAASWSTYDTFFGGGTLASSIKHSRIDDAAEAMSRADHCLRGMRTELADLSRIATAALRLNPRDGLRVMDIWLDNVFTRGRSGRSHRTDLAIHERIKQGQRDVASAATTVAEVKQNLAQRARETRERLKAIDDERRSILTETPS